MKNRIVIREHGKTLLTGAGLLILDICLLADYLINNDEPHTHYAYLATTVIAPCLILYFTVNSAKNKGTIVIERKSISARYFRRKETCVISLECPVYYTLFVNLEESESYILISNDRIDLDKKTIQSRIDYNSQIPIRYTRKVKKYLPEENWIEIMINDAKEI